MKSTKIFYRRMEVEKKIASLKKEQEEATAEWERLANKCNHEITITTWKKVTGVVIFDIKPRTYCLLCDVHLSPRRFLSKDDEQKMKSSVNINLEYYPSICKKWGRDRYRSKLEELYQEVNNDFVNLSEQEIGVIMKNRIDAIEAFS